MVDHASWPKFVLFGDSITQTSFGTEAPWGALIADKLQRKCDILNRGFAGYNTKQNLAIIGRLFTKENSKDICGMTIFLGANDSNLLDLNKIQHVPLEEYKQNLIKMVEHMQSVGVAREKIIIIGPPPCDVPAWKAFCELHVKPFGKCNEATGKYSTAAGEAAKEAGTQFVDLYSAIQKQEDWPSLLMDGLHPSTKGANFLFKQLEPLVEKLTEHLPDNFTSWDVLKADDPETWQK